MFRSFRDLRVWQAGMELAVEVYELTGVFPKHEIYGLTSQMRRAAVSVPSNIAEGHTRESTTEYLRFISIAHGSLAELQTQLELAGRLGYVTPERIAPLADHSTALAISLHALRNSLHARGN